MCGAGTTRPTLHLRQWGRSGPTCLLLHGSGEGGYVWNELACALQAHCRVLAADLRGHGDSPWDPGGSYGVESHVNDVVQLMNARGWNRLVIVGHSCGGDIAIRIAARHRQRVAALVLVDIAPTVNRESLEWSSAQFRALFREYASTEDFIATLRSRRTLAAQSQLLHVSRNALRPNGAGAYVLKCDPQLACDDYVLEEDVLWKELERITCPTLLVRGRGSAVVSPAVARRMRRMLPRARLAEVPLAGHDVMIDNPVGFNAAVLPFLLEQVAACGRGDSVG